MATALDTIHATSDYAEMARRPLEAEQCALRRDRHPGKTAPADFSEGTTREATRNF